MVANQAGRGVRTMATVALAFAAMIVGSLALTSEARASAYGCSAWGAKTVGNIPLVNGTYCALIAGQGTYVDYVSGDFTSAGNVCNYNITAEFFTTSGAWYRTINGPIHYTCSRVNQLVDKLYVRSYVQRGFMCSTLKQNGARITSVCHNVY